MERPEHVATGPGTAPFDSVTRTYPMPSCPPSFSAARRLACLAALAAASCVMHSHVDQLSGVAGIRGEPIEYQTTTSYAIHGLFVFPLWGNAKKQAGIEEFSREAASRGATRMRITQVETTTYWYFPPPISFFVHLVVTSVEGDVEGTVAR